MVAAAFGSDTEANLVERIRASDEYRPELSFVAADSGEVPGHGDGLNGLRGGGEVRGLGDGFFEHPVLIDIDRPSGGDGPGVAHGV